MFFYANILVSTEDGIAKKLLLFKINLLLFTTYWLCIQYIFAISFFKSKKERFLNKEKNYSLQKLFSILEFPNLKFYDVIKYMKQELHFSE